MSESSRAREVAENAICYLYKTMQSGGLITAGAFNKRVKSILSDFEKEMKRETVEACKEYLNSAGYTEAETLLEKLLEESDEPVL